MLSCCRRVQRLDQSARDCHLKLPVRAMKVRESGMPDEGHWETLLDVERVLDRLGIDAGLKDGIELGCGYGTFVSFVKQ